MYTEKFPDTSQNFLAIQKFFVAYDKEKYSSSVKINLKKSSGHTLKISKQVPEIFRNLENF